MMPTGRLQDIKVVFKLIQIPLWVQQSLFALYTPLRVQVSNPKSYVPFLQSALEFVLIFFHQKVVDNYGHMQNQFLWHVSHCKSNEVNLDL